MANYEQHGTMPVLTLDSGEMEYHGTMPVCTGGDGFLADDPATAAAAEDYENVTDDEKSAEPLTTAGFLADAAAAEDYVNATDDEKSAEPLADAAAAEDYENADERLVEPLTITCTGDHRRVVTSPRPIMAVRPSLQDQMREEIMQYQYKIILRRTRRKNGVSDFALAVDTLQRKGVLRKHDDGLVHDIMKTERWDDLPQHLILTMRNFSSARRIDVRAQALRVDVGYLQTHGERREWRKLRKLKRLM